MKNKLYYLPIIVLIFLTLIGCKTIKQIEYVPIEEVRTEYKTITRVDSTFIHDSIDRYISGDSVIITKNHYIYKYLNSTDTLIVQDTIEVPVEVEIIRTKEVNKLKWYQTILMWLGGMSLLGSAFYIGKKIK